MQTTGADDPSPPVPDGLLRLVSGDGFSFIIDEEFAKVSSVICAMMRNPFKESITRVIHLPTVKGCVLEVVCQYFYYFQRFQSRRNFATTLPKNAADAAASSALDSFAESFDVPQELSLDIFLCAKYLDL